MTRYCIECGRKLRTGRKYCYIHKNSRKEYENESFFVSFFKIIFLPLSINKKRH